MSEPNVFASTDDRRVVNNTLRHKYRKLTGAEMAMMERVKKEAQQLLDTIQALPGMYPENAREFAIAKTKLEEATMWAVKGITA